MCSGSQVNRVFLDSVRGLISAETAVIWAYGHQQVLAPFVPNCRDSGGAYLVCVC